MGVAILSIFPIRCSRSLNTLPWSARSSFTPRRGCSRSLRRSGNRHGGGVRATACALCVWRGDHHDEYRRGGNDELATAKVVEFDHFFERLHLLRPGSLSIKASRTIWKARSGSNLSAPGRSSNSVSLRNSESSIFNSIFCMNCL